MCELRPIVLLNVIHTHKRRRHKKTFQTDLKAKVKFIQDVWRFHVKVKQFYMEWKINTSEQKESYAIIKTHKKKKSIQSASKSR